MGNCFSCILPTSSGSNGGSARVIFPKGVTKKFKSVMSVAELMLDAPNHFIVNAAGMVIGQQLSPLTADDELEMGNLYVMLPMTRLNSIVTAGDMGLLLMDATHGKRVVVPEKEDLRSYRMNRRRSRKPILETIAEDKGIQEPGDASAPAVQEPGALEVAPDTKEQEQEPGVAAVVQEQEQEHLELPLLPFRSRSRNLGCLELLLMPFRSKSESLKSLLLLKLRRTEKKLA